MSRTIKVILPFFTMDRMNPVAYYRYPTLVLDCIFYLQESELPEEFVQTFNRLKELSISRGMRWDNKVAIEVEVSDFPCNLFVGNYDGRISLGFSVSTPSQYPKISLI